jgi:hypothetical protein
MDANVEATPEWGWVDQSILLALTVGGVTIKLGSGWLDYTAIEAHDPDRRPRVLRVTATGWQQALERRDAALAAARVRRQEIADLDATTVIPPDAFAAYKKYRGNLHRATDCDDYHAEALIRDWRDAINRREEVNGWLDGGCRG